VAEIPNRLTSLIWHAQSHEEIYDILQRNRCLSAAGLARRSDALRAIAGGEETWRRLVAEPPACGPTREAYIVGALAEGSYLSDRARKLYAEMLAAKSVWSRMFDSIKRGRGSAG
jgi:hypothetical protein